MSINGHIANDLDRVTKTPQISHIFKHSVVLHVCRVQVDTDE